MADYRATENEEDTKEGREDNRLRMERHRLEQQGEEADLLRAMDALEYVDIIPLETEEEETYRLQILIARNRAGNPRTHRAACKENFSENHVHLHDCGEMNVICPECDARHFRNERPPDKKFSNVPKKEPLFFRLRRNAHNHWHNSYSISIQNQKPL